MARLEAEGKGAGHEARRQLGPAETMLFAARGQQVRLLALSLPIWDHLFGEPGLFFAPELSDLYRTPSMST